MIGKDNEYVNPFEKDEYAPFGIRRHVKHAPQNRQDKFNGHSEDRYMKFNYKRRSDKALHDTFNPFDPNIARDGFEVIDNGPNIRSS